MSLKLYIQYDKDNKSGKGKFLTRLVPELENLGVSCSFDDEKADVALVITRFRKQKKPNLPCVIRIDGVHMSNDKRAKWRNKTRIAYAINRSDVVIYQSEYCKKKARKWLKIKNKNDFVIFNGANPTPDLTKTKKPYERMVVSSAKWCNRNGEREHKRINSIFEIARQMPETGFWIAGRTTRKTNLKNVIMLGYLEDDVLWRYLSSADISVYLPDYDWCPNSVIETLCAGTPVIISNNHGGTEIVNKCGGVIVNNIPEAITALKSKKKIEINTEPINIKNIAKKYYEVFKQIQRV